MRQLLLHLPDGLVDQLKRTVPPRSRSAFVQRLLEQALPPDDDDPLYAIGVAVEQDQQLAAEMAEWDITVGDGLGHTG